MKFIHTADLHLGNKMHNVNRDKEYDEFFKWLRETIVSEKADTLVIAGDVYDTINPPTDARRRFNSFLASLLASPCKNVIIVGGNHDSGPLLDANKEIMEALNIHVVGSLTNCSVGDAIFKLFDGDGNVIGICAAIPFIKDTDLKSYCSSEEIADAFGDIATKRVYDEALEQAKIMRGSLNVPIIATGHLHAANLEGRYSGLQEKERHDDGVRDIDIVGNLGSISASSFSNEYDYVALGHIHYTTMVGGNAKLRYSGSPFVMGFDEAEIPHNVLAVECLPEAGTVVNKITVPVSCHFKRLEGNCDELKEQIMTIADYYNDGIKIYIEARYKAEDSSEVNQLLDNLECPDNVEVVSRKIARSEGNNYGRLGNMTMLEMQNLDPVDIFRRRIMDRLDISGENAEEQDKINMYLSYFLDAYNQVQGRGDGNENH